MVLLISENIVFVQYPNLPSTGKVQGVDKAQRGSTSGTTGGQVAGEVAPELGVLVNTSQEDLRYMTSHIRYI